MFHPHGWQNTKPDSHGFNCSGYIANQLRLRKLARCAGRQYFWSLQWLYILYSKLERIGQMYLWNFLTMCHCSKLKVGYHPKEGNVIHEKMSMLLQLSFYVGIIQVVHKTYQYNLLLLVMFLMLKQPCDCLTPFMVNLNQH